MKFSSFSETPAVLTSFVAEVCFFTYAAVFLLVVMLYVVALLKGVLRV